MSCNEDRDDSGCVESGLLSVARFIPFVHDLGGCCHARKWKKAEYVYSCVSQFILITSVSLMVFGCLQKGRHGHHTFKQETGGDLEDS